MIWLKKNIAVSAHVLILYLAGLIFIPSKFFAQCANNNSFLSTLTPAGPGQTATANCIVGGQYVTVNVVSGTLYNFSTCGSGFDTQITLYNAGTGIFVGYNDDGCGLQSTINWVATYTGILWVLIDQYFCSNGSTCATLNITQAGAPPVNDACIGATPISCGATVSGSTVSATPEVVPAACGSSASNSVWYSFVGAGQLVNISLCGSTFDTQLSVLTGACTSLSCVAFNDDDPNYICGLQSSLYFDALIGVTYYIRVSGFATQSGLYTLAINSCDPQTGNDACSGAYALACGQTVSGTIVGMNVDEIPDGCGLEYSAGVWYQFTGTDESVTLDLCGSNYDTQLSVFAGTCTSLICEGTNDDSPLCGVASEVIFHALSGVVYYVYVFGLPPEQGNFDLSMTCAPFVPEPQDCDGAVPLCSDQQFNGNSSGSGVVNDLDSSNQGCLLSGENQSSWYIMQPVTTGTIAFSISPTPIVDYDFAVWGPFPTVQCPITTQPLRCSFSAVWASTGLGNGAIDLTETAGGDGWVAPITVGAAQLNQYYVICLDNFSSTTTPFLFDITLTGVTLSCSLLLPIELGTLNGKSEGQANVIEWTTLSEWNNQQFIIERSDDGVHFEDIGTVRGAGYSQSLLNYSFIDESPSSLLCFYRLRQVDTNGQWSHTHIISIKRNDSFMLSPNPANEYINISSLANSFSSYTVSFYNIEGRKVISTPLQAQNSNGKSSIITDAIPSGLYLVMVESAEGGHVYKTKVLIQH